MIKTIRGYIYHIFPCDVDVETVKVVADDNHIIWKLFAWFFYFIKFTIEILCGFMDVEPYFVIHIPKKNLKKIEDENKKHNLSKYL